MRLIPCAILACLVLCLSAPAASAGDFVLQKNGQWLVSKPGSGQKPPMIADYEKSLITVVAWDYDYVSYALRLKEGDRPQKQKIVTAQVESIYFEPRGGAFTEASQMMEEGYYDTAIQKFAAIAKSRNERQHVRMYSFVNMAEIHEAFGRWEPAIAVWQDLIRALPRCVRVPEAWIRIGLDYLNLGQVQRAQSAFQQLKRLRGLPLGLQRLADYYMIYIRQKQGEAAKDMALLGQALEDYRQLLSQVEKDDAQRDVANLARLGVGNCLVLLEKFGDAQKFFQNIADTSKDRAVLAGAFNGLGQCFLKLQKYKDACLCFLRTEILYDVNPELTAQALYFSGFCFARMEGAGIGEDSGRRAKQQYRKCMQRYQGTPWANAARADLPNVKIRSRPK